MRQQTRHMGGSGPANRIQSLQAFNRECRRLIDCPSLINAASWQPLQRFALALIPNVASRVSRWPSMGSASGFPSVYGHAASSASHRIPSPNTTSFGWQFEEEHEERRPLAEWGSMLGRESPRSAQHGVALDGPSSLRPYAELPESYEPSRLPEDETDLRLLWMAPQSSEARPYSLNAQANVFTPSADQEEDLATTYGQYGTDMYMDTLFTNDMDTNLLLDTQRTYLSAAQSKRAASKGTASRQETVSTAESDASSLLCPSEGCSKRFVRRSDLDHHERYHSARKHTCSLCDKAFVFPKDLKRHMKTHSTKARHVFCTDIGCMYHTIGFSRADHLKRHMQKVHGGSE